MPDMRRDNRPDRGASRPAGRASPPCAPVSRSDASRGGITSRRCSRRPAHSPMFAPCCVLRILRRSSARVGRERNLYLGLRQRLHFDRRRLFRRGGGRSLREARARAGKRAQQVSPRRRSSPASRGSANARSRNSHARRRVWSSNASRVVAHTSGLHFISSSKE